VKELLQKHLPAHALDYCLDVVKGYSLAFKVTRPRHSKFGDYRYLRTHKRHCISVNNNLNPYAFLITYLHECAHMIAFEKYGFTILPHGKEWKKAFQQLLVDSLALHIYPDDLIEPLLHYAANPKASTSSAPALYKILRQYDAKNTSSFLDDLEAGGLFEFKNKKYRKGQKRRTRVVCEELQSRKKYLIAAHAEVIPVSTKDTSLED
jgi:hypothetical protein